MIFIIAIVVVVIYGSYFDSYSKMQRRIRKNTDNWHKPLDKDKDNE